MKIKYIPIIAIVITLLISLALAQVASNVREGQNIKSFIKSSLNGSLDSTNTTLLNMTYYCDEKDEIRLCKDFDIDKPRVCNSVRDSTQLCPSRWQRLDYGEIKANIKQRERGDYVVNRIGRDWVCEDVDKTSVCRFGARAVTFNITDKV